MIYDRRKFRSQTSENMDRWKSRGGKSQRGEEQKRERVRRKKMQMREKVAKSRNGGSKSRLAKAAGAEPCGQMRDEKLHTVVARSTFRSQNAQNTPFSEHFSKLRCRKSARHCGAKHMWKSKCTKQTMFGALLEIAMLKKCTPLWCEAHFEVKSVKDWWFRATFGRSDVVSHGRRKGLCTLPKVSQTWGFRWFCRSSNYNHRYTTFHYNYNHNHNHITLHGTNHITLRHTPLHYTTLHYTNCNYNYNYTTLPYITLHYVHTPSQMQLQLHYTNYITPKLQLHYTTTTTTAALHHTTSSSCGWGDRPGDHCNHCNHCNHSKKTQLQPPFSPSVDSLCHPWFITTNLPCRFSIVETSTTALCATTGIIYIYIYACVHWYIAYIYIHIDIHIYIYILAI